MSKLTPDQIVQAAELGLSAIHLQFIIDTQVNTLFKESVARIRHMPFDLFNSAVEKGCKNFHVVRYLGDFGVNQMYVPTNHAERYEALISGETMYVGSEFIEVRGANWPRSNLPMYLDQGRANLQYVYPIFDWSEAQILAFSISRNLTMEIS